MWLFLAFLLVPLIEIGLFVTVGGAIGLWPTLGIVILTAILGTALVRSQGVAAMGRIKRSIDELSDPSAPLADGAMILFSGALLLTPGFFTDAVGFALLIPGVRAWVFRQAAARVKVRTFSAGGPGRARPHPRAGQDVVEGDYTVVDETAPTRGPSGWTRD